jgi:hypothetical protein
MRGNRAMADCAGYKDYSFQDGRERATPEVQTLDLCWVPVFVWEQQQKCARLCWMQGRWSVEMHRPDVYSGMGRGVQEVKRRHTTDR